MFFPLRVFDHGDLYKEQVNARKEARLRKKYFKSGFGKELLKSIPL